SGSHRATGGHRASTDQTSFFAVLLHSLHRVRSRTHSRRFQWTSALSLLSPARPWAWSMGADLRSPVRSGGLNAALSAHPTRTRSVIGMAIGLSALNIPVSV